MSLATDSVPAPSPWGGFTAVLAGSAVLALGPLFVRWSEVDPIAAAFWRMAMAAPLLWLLARRFGAPVTTPPRRAPLLWAAFFFAADLSVWHIGIHLTSLANAALLSNVTTLLLAAYAIFVLRERPSTSVAAALLVALVGVLLLGAGSAGKGEASLLGDALSLAAAIFYTAYLVVLAGKRARYDALTLLAWVTPLSAAMLLPVALLAPGAFLPATLMGWAALLGLALGSQVLGQGLVITGIGKTSPLLAGLALLVQPIIAGALGWAIFKEVPGPLDLIGAAAILAALILVRLAPTPSRP
jgi:drug/metabolite transporter (DMT)-like permease